jgi:hypothetical protein
MVTSVTLLLLVLLLSTISLAQIPRTLSYQGILSDTLGNPKPDGFYGITFRMYSSASGGSALWSETRSLQVKRGLFSTILGSQTAFPPSLAFDRQYWLSIQVAGDPELTPRIPLSSVGYSLNSLKADTAEFARAGLAGGGPTLSLPYADSASSPNAIFFVSNQGIGGGIFGHSRMSPGVFGGSDSASAVFGVTAGSALATSGVVGMANSTIGFVNGVYGISINSPYGIGTAGWGKRMGVYGVTDTGTGVVGQSNFNLGISGLSTHGVGVRGEVTEAGPGAYGVYGISPGPIAVVGEMRGTGGAGIGVRGTSAALNGTAVEGVATDASGVTTGIRGDATASPQGTGVSGKGGAVGGYFEATTPNGWAGVFNGKVSVNILQINGGSDVAEPFDVGEAAVEPGSVMVIDPDHPGKLKLCATPYDRRVAGIVSGAGEIRPGLTLRQTDVMEGSALVAIAGRVYCRAEAILAPIEVGDLLTTSRMEGYAMRATDIDRARGAVIGKAMTSLSRGTGLVLVLVNLQ